jgi:hypothetical protein
MTPGRFFARQSKAFITLTKFTFLVNTIFKEHLQHVSVEVYYLQGEQNAGFKDRLPLESCD